MSMKLTCGEFVGFAYANDDELREFAEEILAENAKLRELVRDYEHCSMHIDCDTCEYDGTASTHCPLSPCFPDTEELRELGVEL